MKAELIVPALRKIADKEEGRKRKALEELAEAVQHALDEAEHREEVSRQYGDMSMRQRNALHELMLDYAKKINDIDFRNQMKKDANRIIKQIPTTEDEQRV